MGESVSGVRGGAPSQKGTGLRIGGEWRAEEGERGRCKEDVTMGADAEAGKAALELKQRRAASRAADVAPRDLLLGMGIRLGGRRLIGRSLLVSAPPASCEGRGCGVRLRGKGPLASVMHGVEYDLSGAAGRECVVWVGIGVAGSTLGALSMLKVRWWG